MGSRIVGLFLGNNNIISAEINVTDVEGSEM